MAISAPVTFLWHDGTAEEAARFYTALIPNSVMGGVMRAPSDTPGQSEGDVLTVDFTLNGAPFTAINGGPAEGHAAYTDSVSIMLQCDTQEEIDRLWDGLTADGGEPVMCGWLRDRYGLRWQIVPRRLMELNAGEDRAAAKRVFDAMLRMTKIDLATIEAAAAGDPS